MQTDIHTIIEMLRSDPAGISSKFGIPIRTVYHWCQGNRQPPDYVLTMMLTIILLERRIADGKETNRLELGMETDPGRIKEAGKKGESKT